ncbi:MAG: deoxyribodipyrimidine photo-lyase [Candidatus Eremiobacteraeota bacterium]|nr:deoxyribodipyrimidine photo-lyase [Candidatus Eremiobacteraeota bacterium]
MAEAARAGDVVPALVFDPATRDRIGASPRRAAFYCGAVESLRKSLEERGAKLVVRRGPLAVTARALARDVGAETVAFSSGYDAESTKRQRALQARLEEAGLRALAVHDAPAVAPEETAAARSADGGVGYRALVPYLSAWQESVPEPVTSRPRFVSADVSSDLPPVATEFGAVAVEEPPSEARALEALERYLAGPALLYRLERNVPGGERTSHLAADLSFGTIAARTVVAETAKRERDPFLLAEERLSLKTFRLAVAHRDFFFQLAWFFETREDAPLQQRMRGFPFVTKHASLKAWREGRTGYPLVDAGMRELRATGWMHPRVRAIAASFLCFDLGVHWRVGRDTFEGLLIEDDPALANGNWQWIAGVGADLAQFPRIYNPQKQARSYDPRGAYVRAWLPELAALPDADVLDPSAGSRRPQLALPLYDEGARYPQPVVDHGTAARAFLQRYADFTAGAKSERH